MREVIEIAVLIIIWRVHLYELKKYSTRGFSAGYDLVVKFWRLEAELNKPNVTNESRNTKLNGGEGMKCINDKCENGLWSEEGCLFPEGTICSDFIPESEQRAASPSIQPAGSVLPEAQERKIKRLLDDGCGLGSVLLHKVENGRGITAIVSPHGHVEWAK